MFEVIFFAAFLLFLILAAVFAWGPAFIMWVRDRIDEWKDVIDEIKEDRRGGRP